MGHAFEYTKEKKIAATATIRHVVLKLMAKEIGYRSFPSAYRKAN
jgi:hypothetical protein